MGADTISVRCCIAGGGPAGMMLGLLLGRAGKTGTVPASGPHRIWMWRVWHWMDARCADAQSPWWHPW